MLFLNEAWLLVERKGAVRRLLFVVALLLLPAFVAAQEWPTFGGAKLTFRAA
jgi:hypothetical protein